ncbi:serine/threonine protein kinase [Mycolicibacterium wolinskyi]|uniref:non-specific serine/threonine protein kinase n=1 Tax=Mycolicibacterium wolinskyi TaxID=59750 RepID=A0A1X2EYZ3_9MYCO|nr:MULTISPECIES: serine/threonine-protein kinase [Mycolicibacterium]MCV7284924.1 serine/threonine protein kinase [Mycolicibacterium wolinskyi]MCV7292048.1 serine/threonine protein kinase [Mycolicibacterium goodii]ORX11450.1 protein kinase [Mycolicibacterium wolinskyi]
MPLSNGTKIAGYTIERMLGSGGMGEVYLAQHPRLPRHDALKVLRTGISADSDYVERFNREADLAAKLWHQHIVGIHDRGKHRGRLWISMDFVDGTDVSRLMRDDYPDGMPLEEALEIVKAVASALDYAHGRGLLHRDVKPANILVSDGDDGERRILLGDFGVARELADNAEGGLTATNMTVGTAAYAAPEQLMGLVLDGRADQYSLAATTYHLLTGSPLFLNSNPAVVIGQHLNAVPPALSDIRPELGPLDPVLARALAKEPDDRFATCMDFARDLEQQQTPTAAAVSVTQNTEETMLRPVAVHAAELASESSALPAKVSRRGRFGLAAAIAAVLITAAVVTAFVLLPSDESPPSDPFTLAGTLQLPNPLAKTTGLPSGFMCAGTRDYGDIAPNAPITVEDEAGKLLAKGTIQSSSKDGAGCYLKFRVDDVPSGARFYRVHVGQHPEMSYTESEAKAGVEFLIGATDAEPTATSAPPAPKPPPPPSTRTVTVTPEVDEVSLQRLESLASSDRPYVTSLLADRWVPQISSKRVGMEIDGVTWDSARILDQHMRMRATYPYVRLLRSGDWSTYDGPGFWVTVVGLHSDNPYEVLTWCTQNGFDRDNCAAKMVSTWRPVAGSTKYN